MVNQFEQNPWIDTYYAPETDYNVQAPEYDAEGVTSGDVSGWIMSGLAGIQAAASAPNMGRDIRNDFANQFNVDVRSLQKEPRYLDPERVQGRRAGVEFAKAIPVVGQYVSAGMKGYTGVKDSNQAARYFAKLFNDVPEFRQAGLEAPVAKVSGEEKYAQGANVAADDLFGPMRPVVDTIHGASKKIDPLGYGKITDLIGFEERGWKGQGAREKQQEREHKVAKINKSNKEKYDDYTASRSGQPAALKALEQAYGGDPRWLYILRILQNRQMMAPKMERVK